MCFAMHVKRTVRDLDLTVMSLCGFISVSRTVSGCFAVLPQFRSIMRLVSNSAVFHSLVVSLVMPRLDYGNAHLQSFMHASQLRRLQSVLNAAARLIHRSSRYEHVTPMLRDLHWLECRQRIDFKLAVLVHRWSGAMVSF